MLDFLNLNKEKNHHFFTIISNQNWYKRMVFVSKYLVPKGFRGITLFPFIILRHAEDKGNEVLMNHERIHLRQQVELLVLPFYLLYFLEWLVRFCYFHNSYVAYIMLSFEKEAYHNEADLDYLKKRKPYQFLRYL